MTKLGVPNHHYSDPRIAEDPATGETVILPLEPKPALRVLPSSAYREQMLKLEGQGNRPCLTARNSYLPGSCSLCDQPCVLAPGHPTQDAKDDALKAQQREERRTRKLQGKKVRKANHWRVYPPLRKSSKKASVSA